MIKDKTYSFMEDMGESHTNKVSIMLNFSREKILMMTFGK